MQLSLNIDEHYITEVHGAPASNLPHMYMTRARGLQTQLLAWGMQSALRKSRWLFRRVINKSKSEAVCGGLFLDSVLFRDESCISVSISVFV